MAFAFRPLTADSLPLLHEWLQRPHVRAWWTQPSTMAELQRDYVSGMDDPSAAHAYVVFRDQRAIGFIQSYRVFGAGDGWWPDETDPGATGIDQFLADPAQLGQGLGSAMIRAFVERLFEDPRVTTVQTDPSPANERAIRCYRRAGFAAIGQVNTPDGPALLMRLRR